MGGQEGTEIGPLKLLDDPRFGSTEGSLPRHWGLLIGKGKLDILGCTTGEEARSTVRWMTASNSRKLPGQGYTTNLRRASRREMERTTAIVRAIVTQKVGHEPGDIVGALPQRGETERQHMEAVVEDPRETVGPGPAATNPHWWPQ